ncbi:MAG: extracellular solute-binding protein [Chlamydiales bacterium]
MKKHWLHTIIFFGWISLFICILLFVKIQNSFSYDKNTLHIFTWSDIFDPKLIERFQKEKNIPIQIHYYSSNEELLVKLKATGGKGYDLIIPSEYSIKYLIEYGLIKKIDKSKLIFSTAEFIHNQFDPNLDYSIPFTWEVMGLGIDKNFFQGAASQLNWDHVFKEKAITYKISLQNDPFEVINLAAFYLYGSKKLLTDTELYSVKTLLKEQKRWIEAYSDYRAGYLLATRNCPLTVSMSSNMLRMQLQFDFIDFVFPKEGTFITLESCAIPVASTREHLTYEFINFMYQPDILVQNGNSCYVFLPDKKLLKHPAILPQIKKVTDKLENDKVPLLFFEHLISPIQFRTAWVEIKSYKL